MKEIYGWIPWFRALAQKIADSEKQDVIARTKQVRWKKDGEAPQLLLQEDAHFDPFSLVYYIASRSKHAASRSLIYPSLSRAFDIFELANLDSEDAFFFPHPIPLNVLFHDVANKGPGAANPDLLWELFRAALSGANKLDGRMFDQALDIPHVAITKLTHALFLINPHEFVPTDSSRDLTKSRLPKNWDEYKSELAKVRRLLPNCRPYEINVAGYLFKNVRTDRCFQVSSNVYDDGRDYWGDFKTNNWVYTGAPKSGTAWHDYDESMGGYPLSEPRRGDVVLVRRGVKRGLGIGVVYRNDFERSLSEQSKLHVIWVNKNTHQLAGQTARFGFSRATGKTLEAFHSTDSYEATFDLLRSLGPMQKHAPLKLKGEVRDGDRMPQEYTGSVEHALNRILYGPPGTGKTYGTVQHALAIIDRVEVQKAKHDAHKFRDLRFDPETGKGQIAMVTFHQNFAYEDFVEGIRPKLEGDDLSYELHDGIFKRIADAARERQGEPFVLIIDEINRGNIAKIFGELITLIEDSRRTGEEDETEVTLPYSMEPFGVPGNLYIIGTMNTADRSIQLLDTALRRRFTFFEMMPDPEHALVPKDVEGVDCRRMLKVMNERITVLLDREHQIGHTYFRKVNDIERLANAFRNEIFPLLQEYFFDDWGKIRRVLNGNGFVVSGNATSLLPAEEHSDEDTTIYGRLRHDDEKWSDPEEYKEIYAGKDNVSA